MKIKLGLVDDHQLFLDGFSVMLQSLQDFEVVVEARNGRLLQGKLEDQKDLPDLMIIDTDMPVMDGTETTLWLQQYYPSIKLIAMAMDLRDRAIIKMLKAGCRSYLFKDVFPEELKKALQKVHKKGYFNPDKIVPLSEELFGWEKKEQSIILTNEEQQFLQLAFSELSYEQIMVEMNISGKMANRYIDSLFKKFGVKSRLGLVLEASKRGVGSLKDL